MSVTDEFFQTMTDRVIALILIEGADTGWARWAKGYTAAAVTIDEAIEAFLKATGADIRHVADSDSAYFRNCTTLIVLPRRESFLSTAGYYATVLHELTHWAGDEARLGRDTEGPLWRRLAAEEIAAEFGSVFLQAHFGAAEPSMASAAYLRGWWLKTLNRADPKKRLYTAAKAAEESTRFLLSIAA
jgi:antirestriction protein ArdC